MVLRDDPKVKRFIEAARKFRAQIEDQELRGKELVRSLLPSVVELYAAALKLEEIETGESPDQEFSMSHDEWQTLFKQLGERIGLDAWYQEIFDPTDAKDHEPVAGNLADDLADIYRDIIPPLKAWESADDSIYGRVVDEWRLSFSIHWGNHAVGALRTFHWLEMKAGWGGPLRDADATPDSD